MVGMGVATRAASTTSGIQLQVSGELMDDYAYASDLTEASGLKVVRGRAGLNRLLYLGASGAMSLYQDPASDTGWTEEALGGPVNGLTALSGAETADGTALAFGIGINQAAPDLHFARKPPGGKWSAWTRIPVAAAVPRSHYATQIALLPDGDAPALFVRLRPTPGHRGTRPGLWRVDWQAAAPAWTRIADSDQRVLEPCNLAGAGSGLLYGQSNREDPGRTDLFHLAAPFAGKPTPVASGISYTGLAVGAAADGHSVIVIADQGYRSGKRAISVLDGAAPAQGFKVIDTSVTATALAVTDECSTPMAIFALDEKNRLNLIDRTGPQEWRAPFNLQLLCSSISAVTNSQGEAEIYAWLPGRGLHRKWRSPAERGDAPGAGPWREEAIQYQALNEKLTRQKTYATTIAVSDPNGARMADQAVNLRASEIVSAAVGGSVVLLGPDRDVTVRTDAAGRIRLTAPAASLGTCEFSVTLPGLMAAEEDFRIQPNAKVQQRLAAISEADLEKFLSPKFAGSAGDIRKAITAAMTPMAPIDGYRTVRHRPAGRHGHRTPIDTTGMQAFRLDIGAAGARFTPLTAAEAAASSGVAAGGGDGLGGILEFFEDVLDALGHAVENAVAAIGTYIVEPIANAIKVTIEFVAEGIRYATQAVIEAVEQAFQVVDSIFEVVATAFDAVYDFFAWLLADAARDIWNTKAYFQTQLRTGVSQLATFAGEGAGIAATYFATLESAIDSKFGEIEKALLGANLDGGIQAGPEPATAGAEYAGSFMDMVDSMGAASSWLQDKIESVLFGIKLGIDLPSGLVAEFTAALADIRDTISGEVKEAIDGFARSMQQFADNSVGFATMALAALVEAARRTILLVLGIFDGILQRFLKLLSTGLVPAMNAIGGAAVGGSLIAGIYNLLNPGAREEPTVEGLLCLLCAFPATIVYRAVTGSAPPVAADGTAVGAADAQSTAMILSGAVAATAWIITDLLGDFHTGHSQYVLTALIVLPFLVNGLAWPNPAFPPRNDLEKARLVGWILGFLSPCSVLAWAIATEFKSGPRGVLEGQLLLSAIGIATLAMNSWQIALAEGLTLADYAILIGGPLSGIAKPLRTAGDKAPPLKFVLGIADAGSDLALGGGRIKKGMG